MSGPSQPPLLHCCGAPQTREYGLVSVELLFIVTARAGSRRLPGKNVRALGGRSLLEHTQHAIAESGLGAPCLLTTDDEDVAAAGRALGWQAPFLRPAELATDDSTSLDAVLHAMDWFAGEHGGDPDMILLLQPTSPLRGGGCLADAVTRLRAEPEADAVLGVRAWHRRVADLYVEGANGRIKGLEPADQQRPLYTPNGAVYLVRSAALRRHSSFAPPATLPLVMDDLRSLDIDTALDWYMAEALLKHREACGAPPDMELAGR